MTVDVVWVTSTPGGNKFRALVELQEMYVQRTSHYAACKVTSVPSEAKFFLSLAKKKGSVYLILLDSTGKQFSSEAFTRELDSASQAGVQQLIFAIGPADGWSADAKARANLLLSLGAMTLPHALARVVILEQIYRAFTILAGHPYHTGH